MSDKTESKPKEQNSIGFRGGRGPHGGRFMPKARAKNAKGTVKRLWYYLSRKKSILFLVFLLVLASSVFNLTGPLLIGKAIDNYIIPGDLKGLAKMVLLMLAVYGFGALCTWLQNYSMIGVAQKAVMEMRKELFNKLLDLPLSFFDSRPHGDLMSRLTNDVDNISSSLSNSVTQIFSSIITLVGTLSMMLYLSPLLTAFTVIVVPFMFFFTGMIAKRTRKFFVKQQESLGDLNSLIEETISGQKVVKVFCRENESIKEFEKNNRKLKDVSIKAQVFSGIIPPLMNAIRNAGFVIVAAAGGYMAIRGTITVGVIASFINYSKQFARPLNELANQFNMFQSALAGAERVFEIMDEKPEPEDLPNAYAPVGIDGEVSFNNVTFSYKEGTPVLKNINFDVKAGQTIALVGPTGSGKTTIVNLLTRFYDVDEGTITIDGRSISSFERNKLRSSLGIVLQDTCLFSGTVRENIRYGRLDATDNEVEEASRLANAHYFIHRLPEGYDTIITEDGSNFSQGQRQMIAIARAILTNPAILVLDEATSSVDTRTEAYIQEAMLKLMKGRTCFVIAHRLSTIVNADMIFVVKDGEIIERGTHKELLEKKGFYHNLYNSQFRRQAS